MVGIERAVSAKAGRRLPANLMETATGGRLPRAAAPGQDCEPRSLEVAPHRTGHGLAMSPLLKLSNRRTVRVSGDWVERLQQRPEFSH